MKKLFLITIVSLFTTLSFAQVVSADSAKYYEGKTITVSGKVMSTFKSNGNSGKQKIILNLGKPYPDQTFSVVIFEESFAAFESEPEKAYKDKDINVKGMITIFKDKPQIVVTKPDQITIK